MNGSAKYQVPDGPLCLDGPIARPAPGTLPLRGDLAHIALAGTHLAAHYVIPHIRSVGSEGALVYTLPREDADVASELAAGERFELLDIAGEWAWGCLGPQGPSGYVKHRCLAPLDD